MINPRDNTFVPLTTAPVSKDQRSDFRVTILSQAQAAQPFHSSAGSIGAAVSTRPGSNCDPTISVQREGDRITSIKVQCSCGQIIELGCIYEAQPVSK
jgi:hypothetical protein